MNRQGVCIGCGRVLDEIAAWPVVSDTRRRTIIEAARQRRALLRKSGKGRP